MSVSRTLAKAAEMGVDPKWALSCRKRFLSGEVFRRQLDFEYWIARESDSFTTEMMFIEFAIREIKEMAKLKLEIKEIDMALLKNYSDTISDTQIEQARAYPIDRLIEFRHGKALAPCHNDRRPSLFHATRKNLAVCPVCDRKFNPIDWLMEVEGMTFSAAVKQLTE